LRTDFISLPAAIVCPAVVCVKLWGLGLTPQRALTDDQT